MGVTRSASSAFQSVRPAATAAAPTALFKAVRETAVESGSRPTTPLDPSPVEIGLSVIEPLDEAPPRTLHIPSIVRSSPASPSIRAMLERGDFGRRYDALRFDLADIEDRLPGLECPDGEVRFLADSDSFEELSFSVDCLLSHRKRLVEPSIDVSRPRRNVLVFGAGPGGLMTAIQSSLRDHRVVVCEQREVYARNRFIGVYKDVAHLMAALGLPERMTYDFTHYRGKRGIMLADLQTFLHAVALKLGAIIYTGAVARTITGEVLRRGEVDLVRSTRGGGPEAAVGVTRWHRDSVARVRSGVAIRFDTVVDATGGRAGLREILVGRENVAPLAAVAREAAARDPSLASFFDDPEDHCAEFVESDYGCPPGLRQSFAAALLDESEIPDEIPCFVSNIDASVITTPIQQSDRKAGIAARVGEQELDIPPDWVVVECPLSDGRLTRYQIEGPLPQTFDFGGRRVRTHETLDGVNPLSLLVRVLYAMGVPFDAVDRRQLVNFYNLENRHADASDVVATWIGRFSGLRVGGERPIWTGVVPGSDATRYAIVGEALQNAWYRFGVGVDDTFAGAVRFAAGLELAPDEQLLDAVRFEKVMLARSVQVLYHLYAVAQSVDQGVVGPVLTEYHIDEQHSLDVAEARLREEAQDAAEMIAAEDDISGGIDHLLEATLEHHIERSCRRVLGLLQDLAYEPETLRRAAHALRAGSLSRRAEAFSALDGALAAEHRELLLPLLERAQRAAPMAGRTGDDRRREERIIELGLGRYRWATSWLRACGLRAHDPSSPSARAGLIRAAADPDPLVAETAAATLSGSTGSYLTIDKVELLEKVGLFAAIPHEALAGLASLLTERRAVADERIFSKGEVGDCLYLVGSGRVRVHDGDRVLRYLGRHQYFGELSLLDAEPRSADVSAVEATHLFRLDQNDFYVLMSERAEIAQAISRVLCDQLRSATAGDDSALDVPAPGD